MTKLKCRGTWLKDFGHGLTDDPAKAHEFTPDEATALLELHLDYTAEGVAPGGMLAERKHPNIEPGHGRVWARHKGAWLSIEKQDAFLGTRRALRDAEQAELIT